MAENKAKPAPIVGVIDSQRRRLRPPPNLTPEVRDIFLHLVDNSAPDAFREAELPLLSLYASALYLAAFYCERIGKEGQEGAHRLWIENSRVAMSYATKLRLTPQTRMDARAAQRKANLPDHGPAPWERDSGDMAPWND
jgi:hypothetical protein